MTKRFEEKVNALCIEIGMMQLSDFNREKIRKALIDVYEESYACGHSDGVFEAEGDRVDDEI